MGFLSPRSTLLIRHPLGVLTSRTSCGLVPGLVTVTVARSLISVTAPISSPASLRIKAACLRTIVAQSVTGLRSRKSFSGLTTSSFALSLSSAQAEAPLLLSRAA